MFFSDRRIPEKVRNTRFILESAFLTRKMAELSIYSRASSVPSQHLTVSAFGYSQLFHHHSKEKVWRHKILLNKAAIGKPVIYIKTDFHTNKFKNKTMSK